MSRKDNLVKSKSIYTLRSKHTIVPDGTIFENDHVTIVPNDGIYDEDMPLFSDSNFKFRIGNENGGKRKHSRGNFLNVEGGKSNVWTLENLPTAKKSTDGKITLKPNYSTLRDFSYYGSAVEMIKASIRDVIMKYPGGLYYYPKDVAPSIKITIDNGREKTYYLVSNEFNLDFWSPIGCSTDGLDNPMRVLGASYMNYIDGHGNPIMLNACITGNCLESIIGRVSFGEIVLGQKSRNLLFEDDIILGDGGAESESDDVGEIENAIHYELIISTKIKDETNLSTNVLSRKPIKFYGRDYKNNEFYGITYTNTFGVAKIYIYNDNNLNSQWVSDVDVNVNNIQYWRATYTDDQGHVFNNLSGEIPIKENNFQDEIIVTINSEQIIDFPLSVWTHVCSTKKPITGASITYVFKTNYENVTYTTDEFISDNNGFTFLNENDCPAFDENALPNGWCAVVTVNGETITTDVLPLRGWRVADACFVIEEAKYNFKNCAIYGYFMDNTNIGEGNEVEIRFKDNNNSIYTITGETNENGVFSVSNIDFENAYPNVTAYSFDGKILYNGEVYLSETIQLPLPSFNPDDYRAVVYVKGATSSQIKLFANVYLENDFNPLENITVTFKVETNEGYACKTAVTNSNGFASVILTDDEWGCITSDLDLNESNEWFIECVYGGNEYRSSTLYLADEQYSSKLYINEPLLWNNIILTVTNGSEYLQNAFCTICGSTTTCDNFRCYVNGVTDANGKFIVTNNSSNWNYFNLIEKPYVNQIKYWKASVIYQGMTPINPMDNCNSISENTYVFTINTVTATPVVNILCDGMNDDNSFLIYMDAHGNKLLLTDKNGGTDTSVIIEPKHEFIEDFWANIDDFEGVLLNRNSVPLYKSVLETPYIKDGKHFYEYKPYVWPTVNGYVPDVSSGIFNMYLKNLLEIAEYYDEYDTDNLWRMMTHDSIKNLDRTGMSYEDGEIFDSSRMQAMIRIHGRIFDDIKRYADGVKYINVVTYDEKNNMPDYFLSDNVENGGFESKSINEFQKYEMVNGVQIPLASYNVFSGAMLSGITVFEINSEFLKRLSLSKEYILSTKGTRRGIEYILGMFGYKEYKGDSINCYGDYRISEYIRVATNFPNYNEMSSLRALGNFTHADSDNENLMEGYPVAIVAPENAESDSDYYLVPWVKNGTSYENDIYFQEKGGWGRVKRKGINLDITNATVIEENYDVALYNETAPYMMFANDLEELKSISNNKIYSGLICYVTNIDGIYTIYSAETDYDAVQVVTDSEENVENGGTSRGGAILGASLSEGIISSESSKSKIEKHYNRFSIGTNSPKDFSHYFVLVNEALSTHIGYVRNELYDCYGWRNVYLREFKDGPKTKDGLKVLYLESLSLDCKGNNPHCGYGKYDDGESYINKLNVLFSKNLENGDYNYMKNDSEFVNEYNAICTSGFSISDDIEDNEKCYYFEQGDTEIVYGTRGGGERDVVNLSNDVSGNTCVLIQLNDNPDLIDNKKYSNFINPEGGETTEEAASYSVVNVKKLIIRFYTGGNSYFERYLENVVYKYLIEMIPSTAILEFKYVTNCDALDETDIIIGDSGKHDNTIDHYIEGDAVATYGENVYIIENNEGIV